MTLDSSDPNGVLHQKIFEISRHITGSAQITAITLLGNSFFAGKKKVKPTLETIVVIREYQPKLRSYVKIVDGRNIIFLAVDQWIFERDVNQGFLGEAIAGKLILPYKSLLGKDYLYKIEVLLKKRLILESMENLVLNFPELAHSLHINPKYFMYETVLNRVRIFPPLAYGLSSFINGTVTRDEVESVFGGYMEALKQLEKERKIVFSNDHVTLSKKFVTESQKPKVRLINISKNAPRTIFTSVFATFPQLLNFFSQSTEALLKLQKFSVKKEIDLTRRFEDPQKYLFVPTAKGLVSLADTVSIETFVRKMVVNGDYTKIKYETVGGVLNDVYLIKACSNGKEKKILVKRFKDWSGFKWFPLTLWSLGAKTFAVLGRSRLSKECAISEFLRCEGFNVPKILAVSHSERLVFMEYIEGENLSNAVKRIATAKSEKETKKDLTTITRLGEIFAQVHSRNVTLADTKPENMIVDPNGKIYLLDFEQASHDGDKAWDIAVFLYYSGHYLQPLYSEGKAKSIARAFVSGYLKGGGNVNNVKRAGNSKYRRVFSVFTMPSIILAMSNICKKAEYKVED